MSKCLVQELEVEKLLQPNKKLGNLKSYCLKVKDYIKQPKRQGWIQKSSLEKQSKT